MSSEIIVIGAGSVGANVAFRLAQRGAKVTVLEAGQPGGGTSSKSFAWVNAFRKTPRPYYQVNFDSMEEHRLLADELSELTGLSGWYRRTGGLHWEEDDSEQAILRETAERLESWGYPIELISPKAAMELEPDLIVRETVKDVIHTPTEGYVEMTRFIAALLVGAQKYGATIRSGVRVTGMLREGDRIVGVETAGGERLRADTVIDCAGPAADEVMQMAGCEMPFNRVPGRTVYTNPIAITLTRPIHGPGAHWRPDGSGRIMLAHGNHDTAWYDGTPWTPEESLEVVKRHFRPATGAHVEATRVGVRPMPADEKPIMGQLPGLDGFYVAVSHSGVTLGPLWGKITTAEVLDGQPDPRVETFRAARFLA